MVTRYCEKYFCVIPAFYAWSHLLEKRDGSLMDRLQKDWWAASTASAAYWFPVQMTCFSLIPSVHRVAYVSFASFVHKTALSWWAHREGDVVVCAEDSEIVQKVKMARIPPKLPTKPITEAQANAISTLVPHAIHETEGGAVTLEESAENIHESQGAGAPIVEPTPQVIEEGRKPSLGERLIAQGNGPRGLLGSFAYFP